MIIRCATTNPGKLREFKLIFEHYAAGRFTVESLADLQNIQAPEETGSTFVENAALKAVFYSGFTTEMVFADDSGLCVDALGGAPGIYSARYAGEDATDENNNSQVLEDLGDSEDRSARYVCSIAIARDGKLLQTFTDTVDGVLLPEPKGRNGFGYDPLFFYEPLGMTFGEASPGAKLLVSHRGKALARLIRWLRQQTTVQ